MILFQTAILFLLLVFSAAFSASETALTALSDLKIKRLSFLHPSLRPYFTEWLSRPHRLLTTILVGNNSVNIAVSSLAAAMALPLAEVIPARWVDLGVWFTTALILLLFGEMAPKILGRVYRERISVLVLPILSRMTAVFFLFLSPGLWLVRKFAPGLDRAPVNPLTLLSLEELHHIIGESQAEGQMPVESGEMMKRALSLHQKTVGEIRQKAEAVESVPLEVLGRPDRPGDLFRDLLVETGHSRVPVTRGGKPVGYVRVMDILSQGASEELGDWESRVRPAPFVSPDKKVMELLRDFQKSGEHLAFVRAESGVFMGLVTLEDALEEIVGEILDEYDVERKKT